MAEEALRPGGGPVASLASRLARLGSEAPPRAVIVTAPRGWGKRDLLAATSSLLSESAAAHARLDTARCATHPDEFACSYAAAFLEPAQPPAHAGRTAGVATPQARLRSLAASAAIQSMPRTWPVVEAMAVELAARRGAGSGLIDLALSVPRSLAADTGSPLPLLADDLHEILRLLPFPGLSDVAGKFARHLDDPAAPVLIATLSPHGRPRPLIEALRSMLGDKLTSIALPSLDPAAVEALAGTPAGPDWSAGSLANLTGGRLLTCRILAARLSRGASLRSALLAEMAEPGGALAQELRFDYHLLIERTRGHAASRAILNILAREEGLDLTGVARRLRRSAGSTLDYLRWLLEVDLLDRRGRRYRFADPLLRLYVLLHEVPERPGSAEGRSACIDRFLASLESAPVELVPLGRPPRSKPDQRAPALVEPAGEPDPAPPPPPRADDFLMEID